MSIGPTRQTMALRPWRQSGSAEGRRRSRHKNLIRIVAALSPRLSCYIPGPSTACASRLAALALRRPCTTTSAASTKRITVKSNRAARCNIFTNALLALRYTPKMLEETTDRPRWGCLKFTHSRITVRRVPTKGSLTSNYHAVGHGMARPSDGIEYDVFLLRGKSQRGGE